MSGFRDEYLPAKIRSYPWTSSPRTSTTITAVSSGAEHRNRNWQQGLHTFKAIGSVRCHEDMEELLEHWMVMGGPLYSFPMRDPLDFASIRLAKANLEPPIGPTNVILGIGDGVATRFQLSKVYTRGAFTFRRKITLPVVESVLVAANALPPDDSGIPGGPYTFDVIRDTGEIVFDHPVTAGVIVTAGFYFDVPVRFMSDDSFDRIVSAYQVDGFADLEFQEIRPCSDGVSG